MHTLLGIYVLIGTGMAMRELPELVRSVWAGEVEWWFPSVRAAAVILLWPVVLVYLGREQK